MVIKQAFSKEQAADWSKYLWVRLGMDPDDRTTWTRERIHMPWHKRISVTEFSPRVGVCSTLQISIAAALRCGLTVGQVWEAMCDLLGGSERIDEQKSTWGDSFIVNLGKPDSGDPANHVVDPRELDNWHVDGDFFVHFLDSPEQALLVIPLFSDIKPGGGGTYIAPEGIAHVARYLAAHPEGTVPAGPPSRLVSSISPYTNPLYDPDAYVHGEIAKRCSQFVEVTGEVGDVMLLHPLMLHSASRNFLRVARVIINPPVGLHQPFNFNRSNPEDFSLVELKTLRALGVDRLDFQPTTERRRLIPKSLAMKDAALEEEKRRLAEYLTMTA